MRTKIMITSLIAASFLLSCTPKEIFEPNIDTPTFVIIDGDTVKTRKDKILDFEKDKIKYGEIIITGDTVIIYQKSKIPAKLSLHPDVEKIKNIDDPELKGKKFRLIVTGGEMAAGVRNGGYYNEAMEFSFPNLIANQMGIEFFQPYFDANDYNGNNRVVETKVNYTGGPVQKYRVASNNTGYSFRNEKGNLKLKPYIGGRNDNFSGSKFVGGYDLMLENNDKDPVIQRIMKDEIKITYGEQILKEKFDFILECYNLTVWRYGFGGTEGVFPNGFEGYLNKKWGIGNLNNPSEYSNRLNFLLEIKKRKNIKGVLFTTPAHYKLPLFRQISVEEVSNVFALYQLSYLFDSNNTALIYPTSTIDSLLGKNVNMYLKPWISNRKRLESNSNSTFSKGVNHDKILLDYQKETFSLAKSLNFAVVDLYEIYNQIFDQKYITHDGYLITPKNFFASDGVSPNNVGQVVIANETIKAINVQYGIKIPYISSRDYFLK